MNQHPLLQTIEAIRSQMELTGKGIEATSLLLNLVQQQGCRIAELESRLTKIERRRKWWPLAR